MRPLTYRSILPLAGLLLSLPAMGDPYCYILSYPSDPSDFITGQSTYYLSVSALKLDEGHYALAGQVHETRPVPEPYNELFYIVSGAAGIVDDTVQLSLSGSAADNEGISTLRLHIVLQPDLSQGRFSTDNITDWSAERITCP